jgi:hypothetical protein
VGLRHLSWNNSGGSPTPPWSNFRAGCAIRAMVVEGFKGVQDSAYSTPMPLDRANPSTKLLVVDERKVSEGETLPGTGDFTTIPPAKITPGSSLRLDGCCGERVYSGTGSVGAVLLAGARTSPRAAISRHTAFTRRNRHV